MQALRNYKKEYAEFLKGSFWKSLRSACLARDGHECVKCGKKKKLQAHHKKYRAWMETKLEDLITLCESCHGLTHGIRPKKAKKGKRKTGPNHVKYAKWERQLAYDMSTQRKKWMQGLKPPKVGFSGKIFNGSVEEHDHRFTRH